MIDGVLTPTQTRHEWLDTLKNRIEKSNPVITSDDLASLMEHPHKDDFPETIETFSQIGKEQNWKEFKVLFEKEIFAFMVFAK